MPIYKQTTPKGTIYYRAVVYNAKRKRNDTASFPLKREAEKWEAEHRTELHKNEDYDPKAFKSLLFNDVVDKVHFTDRELTVKNQVKEYFKKIKFIDINRDDIQEWVTDEIKRGIKPSTARRYFNTVRKIFREANVKQKLPLPENLFKGITFKVENGTVFDETSDLDDSRDRTLSDLEREYVLKSLSNNTRNTKLYKCLVIFLLESGCRCGEALLLKRKDIRLNHRDIWVPPEITKTKNGRHIPITTPNLENLKELLAMKADNDLLFLGEWKNSNAVSHRWRKQRDSAKELYLQDCAKKGAIPDETFLEDIRTHDFRHTFITRLFRETEMSVIEISNISGHMSLEMLRRYTNIRPSESRHKVW